ncbi:hypothetical protein B481_0688 [Planococcus halocryophilus Or1]|uniref:DUF1697 domain-containing protein n=1 Tax=Planococcus halocryophilus TaxID=1215089 RepID=A0A1C7DVT3_9BACL|nr:DUF1697 domain-containing protein [Planococcus halocryophilus]ANU15323.1 hypothetical protein BBI08_16320 [Planococcus halocryophilus]EMF47682.1 hypothetical protein B481_0688 [Planococcus halocryophilus Or1]
MNYVALLRGINVGGKNKVEMKKLIQAFEEVGMTQVTTYINSGNVVFSSTNNSKETIATILEKAIYSHFDLQIHVLVYGSAEFLKIAQSVPENWSNDQDMKSDVLFLWQDVDDQTILNQLTIKPDIDRVIYVPGAILWSVNKDLVTRSGLGKIVGTALYRRVTVRNVNTVRQISVLLESI